MTNHEFPRRSRFAALFVAGSISLTGCGDIEQLFSTGKKEYTDMTVAEFAKQRDKDECPVGKDIRLGNVAMNLAKDGHVGNTDFYRATAEGAESPAALVRTGIPENSESGTFNGKITIVNGSVALTGNQLGAPECIVIADSIQQVG